MEGLGFFGGVQDFSVKLGVYIKCIGLGLTV